MYSRDLTPSTPCTWRILHSTKDHSTISWSPGCRTIGGLIRAPPRWPPLPWTTLKNSSGRTASSSPWQAIQCPWDAYSPWRLWQQTGFVLAQSVYGLDNRGSIPVSAKDFSCGLCVHTAFKTRPVSCPMASGVISRWRRSLTPSSAEVSNE